MSVVYNVTAQQQNKLFKIIRMESTQQMRNENSWNYQKVVERRLTIKESSSFTD